MADSLMEASGTVQKRKRNDYKAKYFAMRSYVAMLAGLLLLMAAAVMWSRVLVKINSKGGVIGRVPVLTDAGITKPEAGRPK